MKKFIVLILCLICIFTFVGCTSDTEVKNESTNDTSMFVLVEECVYWCVVYHKDTKVMYSVSFGNHNCGVFTVLLNSDGSPMLWNGGNS